MTKYVLPVFKKTGRDGLEYDVDHLLYQHGFAKTAEQDDTWFYSTRGVGYNDAEMHIFTEPAKLSTYPVHQGKELAALVIFHNVSEETYSKIESAVNDPFRPRKNKL